MIGYCVKCREKREMKDPQRFTTKNGRNAVWSICEVCEKKFIRIVGKREI